MSWRLEAETARLGDRLGRGDPFLPAQLPVAAATAPNRGPVARFLNPKALPDFQFPQMENPGLAPPGWRPGFVDYLYTSLTNATAFSPTDTMPLTQTAKLVMAVQAVAALVTVGLVVARAVNILS